METYTFVVWASLIGMGIVFLFLAALSVLMLLMRSFDRIESSARTRSTGTADTDPAASTASASLVVPEKHVAVLPTWAVAAAAVYLDAERTLEEGSASVWTHRTAR